MTECQSSSHSNHNKSSIPLSHPIHNKSSIPISHFNEVNEDVVLKLLNSLDSTKSAGYDNIPASLVKTAAEEMSLPTMNIINQTIRDSKFPHGMKLSEITPIFKTSDVSIETTIVL